MPNIRGASSPCRGGSLARLLLGATLATTTLCPVAADAQTPGYLASFPQFAAALTSPFPGDVDRQMQKKLEGERKFAEVQRLFDLDAWQMFLAVNWPTDTQGRPAPSIADTSFGEPHWTAWEPSDQIFRVDGKRPLACPAPQTENLALTAIARSPAPMLARLPVITKPADVDKRKWITLANLSAIGNISVVDLDKGGETDQAFSGPLIDQNGNFVHYMIMLDPHEVGYICGSGIYNINGQLKLSGENHDKLSFPVGDEKTDWSGATELKFAWKIIDTTKGDVPGRFFTINAVIPTKDGGTRRVLVGLVGMHIAHKSVSSPQWIWATFEQVDNLVGDPLAHPAVKPSFYDPNCETCVPNLNPNGTGDLKTPIQVARAFPIPGDKQRLNAEARAVLAKLGSVWQYYQLIDTQWPTNPSAAPTPWTAGLPGAIDNKAGGNPTPVFLTNATMETYFQKGVQAACQQEEMPSNVPCPPGNVTATSAPKASADTTQVFASESCVGCHSSAGFYKSYDPKTKASTQWPQLSADFSWLPSLKAAYLAQP